ncbi:MAG: ThuA domain-containing protein [Akkermansiaceae bacterium]|nr:ThuA domain-containing protein [Akkermansiaceae bacterium]
MKILRKIALLFAFVSLTQGGEKVLSFKGEVGAGKGKQVVLVSGDEEYRTEESMPMLAKILAKKHGFNCTVLFSWSKDGTYIDPNNAKGVKGWEYLDKADLMIIGTRMRTPSEEDAAHMTKFLNAGKPIIGIRTATHAFHKQGSFGGIKYSDWGLKILGETWVSHHGKHKGEGARAVFEKGQESHSILNSVKDVFGPSDVYGVIHLSEKDTVLLRGAVTKTLDPASKNVEDDRNNPMMPLAWLHPYSSPDGQKTGTSFCTTMGASVDLLSEDLRRLLVNASYHLTGLEVPEKADVEYVDPFFPSFYGFWNGKNAKIWKERSLVAEDFGYGKVTDTVDPRGTPAWPHRPERK